MCKVLVCKIQETCSKMRLISQKWELPTKLSLKHALHSIGPRTFTPWHRWEMLKFSQAISSIWNFLYYSNRHSNFRSFGIRLVRRLERQNTWCEVSWPSYQPNFVYLGYWEFSIAISKGIYHNMQSNSNVNYINCEIYKNIQNSSNRHFTEHLVCIIWKS